MAAIGIHASHEQIAPSALYLHHVGRDQRAFIAAFGEHVGPRL